MHCTPSLNVGTDQMGYRFLFSINRESVATIDCMGSEHFATTRFRKVYRPFEYKKARSLVVGSIIKVKSIEHNK